jgi:hypothetical protein
VAALVVGTLGCSAAPRPPVTIPSGWQNIPYRGLLISVPPGWIISDGTRPDEGQGAAGMCGDNTRPAVFVASGDSFEGPDCGLDIPGTHVDFMALEPLNPKPSFSGAARRKVNGESLLVFTSTYGVDAFDTAHGVDLRLRFGTTPTTIHQVLQTLRRA